MRGGFSSLPTRIVSRRRSFALTFRGALYKQGDVTERGAREASVDEGLRLFKVHFPEAKRSPLPYADNPAHEYALTPMQRGIMRAWIKRSAKGFQAGLYGRSLVRRSRGARPVREG